MRIKGIRELGLILLLILAVATGCADTAAPDGGMNAQQPDEAVRVSFTGSRELSLNDEQQQVISAYFRAHYASLTDFQIRDFAPLFTEAGHVYLSLQQEALDFLIGVRRMQEPDLRLLDCGLTIHFDSADLLENGSVMIALREDSLQTFAAYPDTPAEQYGAGHYFELLETPQGWKINMHLQRGTLYWTLLTDALGERAETVEEQDALLDLIAVIDTESFTQRKNELLEMAERNLTAGNKEDSNSSPPSMDVPYDREAAAAYAARWVNDRNEQWADYADYGGNCQNFASQVLHAGGITMDIRGEQWKWYGEGSNTDPAARGRSPSWTSVSSFLDYAEQNEGFGLVAEADAPYGLGEIGDIIILGYGDSWRHAVVICGVIRNEQGEAVDYLVASNTADQYNFPVSAYLYTRRMLIKIYGYNR